MMGSATAMLTGVAQQGAAAAGQGDAHTGDAAGFLAAMGATQSSGSTWAADVAKAKPHAGDPDSKDAPPDMAAVLAAMLQTVLPTATAAAATQAASKHSGAVVDPDAQAAGNAAATAAAGKNLLANLRNADPAASVATQDPGASQAPAAADMAVNAKPVSQSAQNAMYAGGLRQLLQMMSPTPSAQTAQAAGIEKSDLKQAQLVGQTLGAAAASVALSGDAAQIAAAAPALTMLQADPAQATNQKPLPANATTQAADATLASANLATPAPAHQAQSAVPTPDPTLHAAVGTPRWADELGSRLMLMSLTGQHEGSLNLTPEHLGPLQVHVSVNQNTANVWFGAQHADTRAALADAMPRLRELLGSAGLMLGQAGVSHQAPRQGAREGAPAPVAAAQAANAVDGLDPAARASVRRVALGLVDTYA